ncbi:MAG TPA: DUF3106 domain-containing protein [Gallionella sp.]|nr:DUF3106 domain-containing protein [Gallionella sp.]
MHNILATYVAAGFAMLFSLNANAAGAVPAQDTSVTAATRSENPQDVRKEMRDHWEQMSPEEREQVRKKMKDHWNSMSQQEREASRQEMRDHFKNMTPEERKQFDRDMGKQDGRPPPDGDYPGDSTVNPERTSK